MLDVTSILDKAKNLGLSAEIYYVERKEYEITREKQTFSKSLNESGYGLRVFKDGRVGFAYSTKLEESLLQRSMDTMKVSEKDEANYLPEIKPVNSLPLFYKVDPFEICKTYIEELSDLRGKINVISITSSAYEVKVGLENTEGEKVEETRSGIYAGVIANYVDGSYVGPEIYEYSTFRYPKKDLTTIKDTIISKVQSTAKRIKLDFVPKSVIFTPKAMSELFVPLFSRAISEEYAYRRRTPLRSNDIIKEGLKIVDDPTIGDSIYSRSFDGEGIESKLNVILDGQIKTYLSNTYWARKAHVENTASAYRNYSSQPVISPTNLLVRYAEHSVEENSKVVVDSVQGVHTSNFDTGEFSVVSPVAWLIKDGKRIGLRELTVTGDLLQLIRGILAISKAEETYGNLTIGNVEVEGISIA
ncbi:MULTISPECIES: TldD/PmbA family protein [Acidianus]|uniref:Peptidase U62 n=1 Tax=Candidatus Acidianus copahuensis TaxID=1160895 RepID=A0A031LN01_9CREN|nr:MULTISPECIES: TldD/PmbA family protein [Acidianus]EZQ04871.1 hypothetical protein CM19_07770 [Candidatus Acidianus copahuensis]NON61887.1 TldD/PmbA family protein [Acidianus sp. RZ1]